MEARAWDASRDLSSFADDHRSTSSLRVPFERVSRVEREQPVTGDPLLWPISKLAGVWGSRNRVTVGSGPQLYCIADTPMSSIEGTEVLRRQWQLYQKAVTEGRFHIASTLASPDLATETD